MKPKESLITVKSKEDLITVKPKENLITVKPKENPKKTLRRTLRRKKFLF